MGLNKINLKRAITVLICVLFILSLVPIFFMGSFNSPSADDYNTYVARRIWNENHSITEFTAHAWQTARSFYFGWQGTYTMTFLMPFQPAVFGEQYYVLTVYLMLLPLLIAYLYFTKKLIVDLLKQDIDSWLIIFCITTTISIQFLPQAVSAFYWFNSAVLYVLGHAAAVFLFGLVISIIQTEKIAPKIIKIFIGVLFMVFIGGENYVTALITPIILFLIFAWLLYKDRKNAWAIFPIVLSATVFSLICFLAPGNAVRGVTLGGYGVFKTILYSFYYGLTYVFHPTVIKAPVSTICFSLIIVLLFYKTIKNKAFGYKYPLVVVLIAFCVFSVQFAPSFFAMNETGPPRLKNVIYFSYIFYFVFITVYVLGWVYKKIEGKVSLKHADFNDLSDKVYRRSLIPLAIILLVFGVTFLGEEEKAHATTLSAYRSISSGEAEQYLKEYHERVVILKSDEKDVVLDEYSVKPYLLHIVDITEDPDYWINRSMAKFYGKDSIRAKQ